MATSGSGRKTFETRKKACTAIQWNKKTDKGEELFLHGGVFREAGSGHVGNSEQPVTVL
jgi:hypothetical protein